MNVEPSMSNWSGTLGTSGSKRPRSRPRPPPGKKPKHRGELARSRRRCGSDQGCRHYRDLEPTKYRLRYCQREANDNVPSSPHNPYLADNLPLFDETTTSRYPFKIILVA